MFNVGILLINGFGLMSYASLVEPLRAANLLSDTDSYKIININVNNNLSVSSSGVEVKGKNFYDKRGYFKEIYIKKKIKKHKPIFWCMSKSKKNVLRGLHFQNNKPQGKYISVMKGKILDVAVDLRKKSKTFGKTFSIILFGVITFLMLGVGASVIISHKVSIFLIDREISQMCKLVLKRLWIIGVVFCSKSC